MQKVDNFARLENFVFCFRAKIKNINKNINKKLKTTTTHTHLNELEIEKHLYTTKGLTKKNNFFFFQIFTIKITSMITCVTLSTSCLFDDVI